MTNKDQSNAATVVQLRPAIIDSTQAAAYVCLSVSTMENLERKGLFPRKRQLSGRRSGYLVREIDEWIEQLPVSDLLPPAGSEYGRAGKNNKSD